MAVGMRDIPITRDMVHQWLEDFDGQLRSTIKMRDFITARVTELQLPDEYVSTPGATSRMEVTHIVDFILEDIESYG
jgi:hypothetical protein